MILCASALGAAAVFGALKASAWLRSSEIFTLENVRVRGVRLVDTSDVLTRASLMPGTQLVSLDAGEVAERLRGNPFVKDASVRRRLPNTIDIEVKERRPEAIVARGRVYLTDRDGRLLELVAGRWYDVPVVSGLSDTAHDDGSRWLTGKSLEELFGFLDVARAACPDLASSISQVEFGARGCVRFTMAASPTVVVMDIENVSGRMQQLCRLAAYRSRNNLGQPGYVDLRYDDIAYVQEAGPEHGMRQSAPAHTRNSNGG
jgi:cell division septal protein FtsQ